MTRNEDVRVRRTRRLLRDALVDLVEERGFDGVSVTALVDRAMISRAAFYRNYRDKYQLVEAVFDEAMAELLEPAQELSPARRWTRFFEHVAADDRLYRALLVTRRQDWFVERVRGSFAGMVRLHLADGNAGLFGPHSEDAVSGIIAAVFVQTIAWWLGAGRPIPPAAAAAGSARLVRALVEAATG